MGMHLKQQKEKYLKMKDLREKTGLPASTINYYLRNGLLPEPVKTGKNMAWYPESTISRLNLIKKLQERNRLTISEIAKIISSKKNPDELYVMETVHDFVFGEGEGSIYEKEEFLEVSGLKEEELEKLLKHKIIMPWGKDLFNESDLIIAEAAAKGLSMGLKTEDLNYYGKAAEITSLNEMKIRKKLTENLDPEKNAEVTFQLTDMARKFRSYVFERAFQEKVLGNKNDT